MGIDREKESIRSSTVFLAARSSGIVTIVPAHSYRFRPYGMAIEYLGYVSSWHDIAQLFASDLECD